MSDKFCRGCGRRLRREDEGIADNCPCNSPRGINHGLVPAWTCTCLSCDPMKTGGARVSVWKTIASMSDDGGELSVTGKCLCGRDAKMTWSSPLDDGTPVPRCDACVRSVGGKGCARIDKGAFDHFAVMRVMSS